MLASEGAITYSDWNSMDHDEVSWYLKELSAHHERMNKKAKSKGKPR